MSGTGGSMSWNQDVNTLQGIVAGATVLEFTMYADGTNSTFEVQPATHDTSGASGQFFGSATGLETLVWNHSERCVMFQNNGANNVIMNMDDLLIASAPEPETDLTITDFFVGDFEGLQFDSEPGVEYKLQQLVTGFTDVWESAGGFLTGHTTGYYTDGEDEYTSLGF